MNFSDSQVEAIKEILKYWYIEAEAISCHSIRTTEDVMESTWNEVCGNLIDVITHAEERKHL